MTAAHEPSSPPSLDASPGRPAARLILALLRESRVSLALALTACVLNGVASVLLVATLNRALSQPGAADASLA
jgi:putative pyoverdin transport system ATP-binding/permease protein